MTTASREGVIKFHLNFVEGPAPQESLLVELNRWRTTFRDLGLIGQDPRRYGGLGFGNLSRRLPGRQRDAFIISGTQTGHLRELQPKDYATVISCDPEGNRLSASGLIRPSSEALSHGILYQCDPDILWVMHLHSPDIFNRYIELGLPFTSPSAEYGTTEMAMDIRRLAKEHDTQQPGLLVMAGHQDGILAFGRDADMTGGLILEALRTAGQYC